MSQPAEETSSGAATEFLAGKVTCARAIPLAAVASFQHRRNMRRERADDYFGW
jgi:hypothetical protein